ncbi:MAG: hypothetical protein WCJ29_02795 [bacterium]
MQQKKRDHVPSAGKGTADCPPRHMPRTLFLRSHEEEFTDRRTHEPKSLASSLHFLHALSVIHAKAGIHSIFVVIPKPRDLEKRWIKKYPATSDLTEFP